MSSLYNVTETGITPNPLKPTPSTNTSEEYVDLFKKETTPDTATRLTQKHLSSTPPPTTNNFTTVYSHELEWIPCGDQEKRLKKRPEIMPNILITKLRTNQKITLEAHCKKSTGSDHAKFSPVCTASYRMMPVVTMLEKVEGEEAEELVTLEPGVFKLVEKSGKITAEISDPLASTMSRNFMRNPSLAKKIKIERSARDFIFSIEAVGQISPVDCLVQAIEVLKGKGERLKGIMESEE
ncbi:hypothetical protein TrLO_g4229 [Triparma laevis f. longispina]|uniref:DNA-directed RNA polymerase RpoA/D/Rpb3-type domain-containing protein n=1 Tax=Triparma laevis f. longispina TaxID=1714387 RepID=A0A9W7EE01_9STRA|nr:hypothetical protein TrLO_g4229 [Triparma laevis f. longispina]